MRFRRQGRTWRLARSLVRFAGQIEDVWPERHRTDGTVGDLAHQARRSDHNPNRHGVVTAIDVGIVDNQGADLVKALVRSRDARVKYIIFNRRIWRSYKSPRAPNVAPWEPAPYSGANPHVNHVHLSVSADPIRYDNPAKWFLDTLNPTEPEESDEMVLRSGDRGNSVKLYQRALNEAVDARLTVDGVYLKKTVKAVKRYQEAADLPETGIIDGVTAANLSRYVPVN